MAFSIFEINENPTDEMKENMKIVRTKMEDLLVSVSIMKNLEPRYFGYFLASLEESAIWCNKSILQGTPPIEPQPEEEIIP